MSTIVSFEDPVFLLGVASVAIAFLLFLIIKLKVHAFISLSLVSFGTAIATGVSIKDIVPTMTSGFGSTLASVALLVGLGAMIGKILEESGGAKVLADTLIGRFGKEKAPFALGIASLLFGFPIFFDAGLVVMMPIILAVASRFGGSTLKYALPSAGAFAVMHAFVPPHPGPVAAAGFLNANISLLLVIGALISIPTWYLGAYLFGIYSGKKFNLPISGLFFDPKNDQNLDLTKLPKFSTVIVLLILPVVFICMNTGLKTLGAMKVVDENSTWVQVLEMFGQTPIALLLTLLICLAVFAKDFGMAKLEKLCGESLAPICGVILVTGAGGMFGGVLRASGIGNALANLLTSTGLPVIVASFIIASCLRVAQGSATVALTTAASLIAPVVASNSNLSQYDLCFIVVAIAGGATVLSHFNDSGFWLVSRLLNMDEKTTLKTWTVMETLLGVIAFAIAGTLSIFF